MNYLSRHLTTFFQVVISSVLIYSPLAAQKANKKSINQSKPETSSITSSKVSALKFRSIGPAVTSGRISDFAFDPLHFNTYYVATASGGVWKTTNHGTTFNPIFDNQGSYSIGCITLDKNNVNTVWVGTGENNNQRSVAYGDGIYKSEDGGTTWVNKGLTKSEHISNIIVHPNNSNIIYVGAYGPLWNEGGDRGVYKSIDGGNTWKCIKSVSSFTGCNNLIMDPSNPEVLYASFHQRMRKVFTYVGGGPESGLYKSVDGGNTWMQLSNGLPSGDIGRIGIDVSPVSTNFVYAVVEASEGKGGIYKSTDYGASWVKQSGSYTSGNYYQELTCDPVNPNKIFISDTYYKVSYDGGKTVSNLGEINKHIDNHAIWINPNNTNHLIIGCDGGIYETYDHAQSYDYKSNLPVTQFYKVSTDNSTPFYHVHGGTQDNLSLGGPSRTTSGNGITNADWYVTSTGDGFETQVDPKNPDIVYAQSQYGGLVRFDKKNGEYLSIKPIENVGEPAYRWNWDSPLIISSHDNKTLYFGANKLFRSNDQGNSWNIISPDLSRQLDRNTFEVMGKIWSVDAIAKNTSTDIFGQTTTIAESSLDPQVLWVGTDDGLIHFSNNGGHDWKKIDKIIGVPNMSYVQQIIASQFDKNTAYVCFNHHRYGDFKPYVFKTEDAGNSWTNISGSLPSNGAVYTIAEDHVNKNLLFVGTEFGCFFTSDGGGNWIQLKSGLPTIAVRDIEIQRRENDLVLGTFGRGFYILDDYTPLRHLTTENLSKESHIFPIKDALLYIQRLPLGLRDKGHLGSNYFRTENPEVGAVFTYYIKDEYKTLKEVRKSKEANYDKENKKYFYPSLDSLRLEDDQIAPYLLFTITDSLNNVIRHIKSPHKTGIHRLVWDLRFAPFQPVQNRYVPSSDQLFGSAPQGHLVPPGKYFVSISQFANDSLTIILAPQSFNVTMLAAASLPSSDFKTNVNFYKKASDLSKSLSAVNDQVSQMENTLKMSELAVFDMPAPANKLLTDIYSTKKLLRSVKIELFGDETLARREFETSPSINDRVNNAVYSILNSTSQIPDTHIRSLDIALSQFDAIKPEIIKINDLVISIESQLNIGKAPHTPGRKG